jgi:hypothetical protein
MSVPRFVVCRLAELVARSRKALLTRVFGTATSDTGLTVINLGIYLQ